MPILVVLCVPVPEIVAVAQETVGIMGNISLASAAGAAGQSGQDEEDDQEDGKVIRLLFVVRHCYSPFFS